MPKQRPNNLNNQPSQKNTSLPIEVIRGKQFMDNKSLSIIANHAKNTLTFTVSIQLGDSIHLPMVYNSSFREYEDADHIELTVSGRIGRANPFSVQKEKNSLTQNGTSFSITMDEDDFHTLNIGKDTLLFEFNFKYMSFFGKYATEKIPISALVKVPFEIDPIYESRAHFKSLKLNKEQTLQKLGGEENDFGDGTPEACIHISSNHKTIIYEKAKNNYSVNRTRTAVFYHSEPNPYINLGVYDADYGLNFDDLLGDTLIQLNNLIFPTYQHVAVECADELKVYFTTKGQINR